MKRLASILILLALMFQAAIPLGFMPGQAMAGTTMVICSGMDVLTIHLDADGNPIDAPMTVESPCAFSMIPTASTVDAPPAITLPLTYASASFFHAYAAPEFSGAHYTPPATAPPV